MDMVMDMDVDMNVDTGMDMDIDMDLGTYINMGTSMDMGTYISMDMKSVADTWQGHGPWTLSWPQTGTWARKKHLHECEPWYRHGHKKYNKNLRGTPYRQNIWESKCSAISSLLSLIRRVHSPRTV
jgi:hypothetical protein